MKEPIGKATRTPTQMCLNCGKLIDAASGVGHSRWPKPDDITVCIGCGHIMVYTNALHLREPTASELFVLSFRPDIQKVVATIKELARKRSS